MLAGLLSGGSTGLDVQVGHSHGWLLAEGSAGLLTTEPNVTSLCGLGFSWRVPGSGEREFQDSRVGVSRPSLGAPGHNRHAPVAKQVVGQLRRKGRVCPDRQVACRAHGSLCGGRSQGGPQGGAFSQAPGCPTAQGCSVPGRLLSSPSWRLEVQGQGVSGTGPLRPLSGSSRGHPSVCGVSLCPHNHFS